MTIVTQRKSTGGHNQLSWVQFQAIAQFIFFPFRDIFISLVSVLKLLVTKSMY